MFAVWVVVSRECNLSREYGEGRTFAIPLVPRGGSHGVYPSQSYISIGYGDVSTFAFRLSK